MFCGQCGAQIAEDAPYCRHCGAPRPNGKRPARPPAGDAEVRPLLARANLARLRRQYPEAASSCIEVLRVQPKNATAHSLLGDIYRDQRMLRDAIEWYKLALELEPGNRADRDKLDDLIDRVYTGPAAGPAPKRGGLRRLARRICAALRCAELTRPVRLGMSATVLLLLVLLIALVAYRASLTPSVGASTEAPPPSLTTPPPSAAAPPVPSPAPPAPAPAGAPPQAAARQGEAAAAPAKATQGFGLAARERRLMGALRASPVKGERPRAIDSVMIDPRSHGAIIDMRAPELATPTDTKRNLILVALSLAQAAHRADARLTEVTVRGALPIPDSRGKKSPEYAFVGEIRVAQLPDPQAVPLSPDRALELFSNVWWHPLFRDLVP